MNISAKTEYACIAVLELALNYGSGDPVTIRAIAETHGIPSRFLVQILLQLKGTGIVGSTRGAARAPASAPWRALTCRHPPTDGATVPEPSKSEAAEEGA